MKAAVTISASWHGKGLDALQKVLQDRMKYMHETARESVAAMMITTLQSLRTMTKVAKLSSIKVTVQAEESLRLGWLTKGGVKKACLRLAGSGERYGGSERLVLAAVPTRGAEKSWQIYRFTDSLSPKRATYLIAAPSAASAKSKAKDIVRSRQIRYAGLAKRALGVLMMKTGTKRVADAVPQRVTSKAKELTDTREIIAKSQNGGKYALVVGDNLRYAVAAIKGGRQMVDLAAKKAANKTTAVINRVLKKNGGFLGPSKLPTPFPELVRKKKA